MKRSTTQVLESSRYFLGPLYFTGTVPCVPTVPKPIISLMSRSLRFIIFFRNVFVARCSVVFSEIRRKTNFRAILAEEFTFIGVAWLEALSLQ